MPKINEKKNNKLEKYIFNFGAKNVLKHE